MPIIKYFEELGKLWRIDATKTAQEVKDEVLSNIDIEKVYPNKLRFNH